jgi:FkbM family methyltransferase
MGALRSALNWSLNRFGYYVVKGSPYSLPWYLRQLLPRLGVNCVLDVGAHWGEFGRILRSRAGYNGRLVSFEPMQSSFDHLQACAAGDEQWRTYHLALGDDNVAADLRVFRNTELNSLLATSGYGAKEFGSELELEGTERIDVRTIDDLIHEHIDDLDPARVFLKLDTQGYDLQVIAGALRSLEHVVAIQTELAVGHLYENAPKLPDAILRLESLGFEPTGFFPITLEGDGVHVFEFDCVLVRKPIPRSS